jgi:hypothetical protein
MPARPASFLTDRKLALLVSLVAGAGCASSVLVRTDDAIFRASQQRLAATAQRVDQENPSTEERLLFLQAESLYRYRFEMPQRGATGYLAQGAAAVFDFPALQSLAGSLDLVDLRLRTYDGSVQLWETLLQRHPDSRLRPLTLYRLGWAYRSTGVSGLPRESGDEAFAAIAREFPGSTLAPLAREAARTPWKSKTRATELSLLPGLGQIYVGEPLNGAVRLAIAVVGAALVAAPLVVAYERRQDLTWHHDWPLLVVGVGGLALLSIDYTAAYQDALRGVVDYNERVENEFETRHPDAP